HHPPWRDRYLLAGLGIAPDPLALLAHDERAKRGKFHRLAALKAVGNFLQHEFDERRRFRAREADLLVNGLAQIRTRYGFSGHRLPRLRRLMYPSVLSDDIRLAGSGQ